MITTDLSLAKSELQRNAIIAIPTETVYGLAGNAFNEVAIAKIFALKQRPLYNPLIVHIKSADYLDHVAKDIPQIARQLADKFWPGPLTLVLPKQVVIPDIVTAGKDTVAVRVPSHPMTQDLLQQLDFPIAAPSANPFGSISPTTAQHVDSYFAQDLNVILDGGTCQRGIESTIVGFSEGKAIIYRLGSLSIEAIEAEVGKVTIRTLDDHAPAAPGMLSKHYAPKTPTVMSGDIPSILAAYQGKRIGLLVFQSVHEDIPLNHQEVLSPSGDLEEAAQRLYAAMHRLDSLDLEVIVAEQFPEIGIGQTLNDKLRRASSD